MIAALAGGALFMHTREFALGGSRRPGNRALWRALQARTFAGWEFRSDDAMWNSGVIGLGAADLRLIDDALHLYDTLGSAGVRHFATEQLVVGLVLGRTGRLRAASEWFTHYWGNKSQFEREIERRLQAYRHQALSPPAAADALRRDPIDLPAEVRLGRVQKVLRWMGRRRR
jgi:hypothetical protein